MPTCRQCKEEVKETIWTNIKPLCRPCHDAPRWRYYYLNRPPAIGCQPDGFVDREGWWPSRDVEMPGGWARNMLGWVEYLAPLAPEQVWKWEFWPADEAEFEQYQGWREENNR